MTAIVFAWSTTANAYGQSLGYEDKRLTVYFESDSG
jgi:hypothetical protein